MVYRKGELSKGTIDREWPHQVALRADYVATMRPGNRYGRETGSGRTLGQLIASKMALVAICRRCKHQRVLFE